MLVAAALHFVGIPAARAIAPEHHMVRTLFASAAFGAQEVEVDVDLLNQLKPPETRVRDIDPRLPIGVGRVNTREPRPFDSSRLPPPSPTSEPRSEPAENAVDAAESGQDTDFTMPPSEFDAPPPMVGNNGLPGFGGPGQVGAWAVPGLLPMQPDSAGDAAPTRAPERRFDAEQGTKAMERAMRHKDRNLGIDRPWAGAIASVIVGAVRAADTPHESRGSFSVRLGANGAVQGVSLISSSGGSSSIWRGVAASAAAQLKGRSFVLGSNFAKGAVVVVTAVSAVKMPGGGTSRSGATVSFDVADVGARPTRVVTRSISVHAIE